MRALLGRTASGLVLAAVCAIALRPTAISTPPSARTDSGSPD